MLNKLKQIAVILFLLVMILAAMYLGYILIAVAVIVAAIVAVVSIIRANHTRFRSSKKHDGKTIIEAEYEIIETDEDDNK